MWSPGRGWGSIAIAVVLAGGGAEAQTSAGHLVRGTVIDTTGYPIAYTHISVSRAAGRVADDSGRFTILLRNSGPVTLGVRRVGFRPFDVTLDIVSDTTLLLVMRAALPTLEAVRAEADGAVWKLELSGFYRRMSDRERGMHSGWFITPEELERRVATRTTNLLQGIPGVRVQRVCLGGALHSGCRYEYDSVFGNNGCPMMVYLDGVRVGGPSLTSLDAPMPADLDPYVTLRELAGIEIYSRFPPPGYELLNGTCGVVLLWTK